jgi:hypothetical protein
MTAARRLALGILTAAALLGAATLPALAGPSSFRMGVTDHSTAMFMQPLIWMRNNDGMLVAKYADQSTWIKIGAAVIDSAPDGVSWTDGAVQRQRVFFIQSGRVQMLTFDDNLSSGQLALPEVGGLTFQGFDVKSVLWSNAGVQTITVVAPAVDSAARSGYLCAYETPAASAATSWTVWCSGPSVFAGPDIAAAPLFPPRFFFTNASAGLGSLIRTGAGVYGVQTVAFPTGLPGIGGGVVASGDAGQQFLVAAISTLDHHVWVASLTGTATTGTWSKLPALPGNINPGGSTMAIGIEAYNPPAPTFDRTILVVGSDLRLYRITRHSTSWPVAWDVPPLVAGSLQTFTSVGVTVPEGPFAYPVTFLVAGPSFPVMLELGHGGTAFIDHVGYGLGLARAATGPANETSSGFSGTIGAMSAIQRNTVPPWQTLAAQMNSGGTNWGQVFTVNHRPPYNSGYVRSASDPVFAAGAGNNVHYVDLEWDMTTGCVNAENSPTAVTPLTNDISYRRGTSVSAIAGISLTSPNYFHVAGPGNLDHPFLGLTGDIYASGVQSPVWVLFLDVKNGKTMQWTLNNNVQATTDISASLPAAAPVVFTNQFNAYGTRVLGAGWPQVCLLSASSNPTVCGTVNNGVTTNGPKPEDEDIAFGPALASQAGGCALRAGNWYDCYDTEQPAAFATDPNATGLSVFVAYQSHDPTGALGPDNRRPLSVYFVQNTNASLTSWTTPIRIHTRTAQEDYFDPAISVDGQGTVVVTYSVTTRAPVVTTGSRADVRLAWSTVGNTGTWTPGNAGASYGIWFGASLPYHCTRRRHFLGEYRNPSVVGSRAFHQFPASANGATPTGVNGEWFSRATIN